MYVPDGHVCMLQGLTSKWSMILETSLSKGIFPAPSINQSEEGKSFDMEKYEICYQFSYLLLIQGKKLLTVGSSWFTI